MTYHISEGIPESKLAEWLANTATKYGTFADQRVDYTSADIAPIVMCTVVCGGNLLLVKRGFGMADAEGYWSTINGYIDELKPVAEQARQELKEELSIDVAVESITVRPSYTLHNPQERRRYIVFPCLVSLPVKPPIILDEEHTEYRWTTRSALETFDTLEDLPYSVDTALGV